MSFIRKNAKKFNIDPSKMVLVGGSAGAALVMQTDLGLREGYVKSYDATEVSTCISYCTLSACKFIRSLL